MTDQKARSSKVVPVLVAALLCDSAVADPTTGKKTLIGIFDRVWAAQFPTARPLTFYGKITDAEGQYTFTVRIVLANKNKLLGEAKGEMGVPDRLQAFDFLIQLPPVVL